MMNNRLRTLLLLVFCITLSIPLVRAQDTIFMPQDAQEANEWSSPPFETTKDTRIEWNAYPVEGSINPLFSFIVVEDGVGIVRREEGLDGMAFLDQPMIGHIEVTGADIRIWEIRLFGLAQPVVTTTPTTTTTEAPPITTTNPNPPEQVVTVTQTVAVYEALPPESWMVTWGYIGIGILATLVVLLGILLFMLKRNVDIVLARPIQEGDEEEHHDS